MVYYGQKTSGLPCAIVCPHELPDPIRNTGDPSQNTVGLPVVVFAALCGGCGFLPNGACGEIVLTCNPTGIPLQNTEPAPRSILPPVVFVSPNRLKFGILS